MTTKQTFTKKDLASFKNGYSEKQSEDFLREVTDLLRETSAILDPEFSFDVLSRYRGCQLIDRTYVTYIKSLNPRFGDTVEKITEGLKVTFARGPKFRLERPWVAKILNYKGNEFKGEIITRDKNGDFWLGMAGYNRDHVFTFYGYTNYAYDVVELDWNSEEDRKIFHELSIVTNDPTMANSIEKPQQQEFAGAIAKAVNQGLYDQQRMSDDLDYMDAVIKRHIPYTDPTKLKDLRIKVAAALSINIENFITLGDKTSKTKAAHLVGMPTTPTKAGDHQNTKDSSYWIVPAGKEGDYLLDHFIKNPPKGKRYYSSVISSTKGLTQEELNLKRWIAYYDTSKVDSFSNSLNTIKKWYKKGLRAGADKDKLTNAYNKELQKLIPLGFFANLTNESRNHYYFPRREKDSNGDVIVDKLTRNQAEKRGKDFFRIDTPMEDSVVSNLNNLFDLEQSA